MKLLKTNKQKFIELRFPSYFTSHSKPKRLRSYLIGDKNDKP